MKPKYITLPDKKLYISVLSYLCNNGLLNVLFFISDPPNISLQNKYSVGREKSVSLDCKVDGYPLPTITWTPCDAPENVCNQSMLNISNVQYDGVYICTAKNSLGNDTAHTSLGKSFYFMCASFLCTICFCFCLFFLRLTLNWWEYYSIICQSILNQRDCHFFVIVLTKVYHQ